jgi:hypothetical protein
MLGSPARLVNRTDVLSGTCDASDGCHLTTPREHADKTNTADGIANEAS